MSAVISNQIHVMDQQFSLPQNSQSKLDGPLS